MGWQFKNFVSERGENHIRSWINTLPKKVRFKIDARIKYLQTVEELKYPYVEKWKGADDLYEVRVVFSGVMYRMLGCYEEGKEFVLLIGAIEKGGQLEPRSAVTAAITRMSSIKDKKYVCDHFKREN